MRHSTLTASEPYGDLSLGPDSGEDAPHSLVAQGGASVPLTRRHFLGVASGPVSISGGVVPPTAGYFMPFVFQDGSQNKMIGVDAGGDVALMLDLQAVGNRPISQLPSDAGSNHAVPSLPVDRSPTTSARSSDPQQASTHRLPVSRGPKLFCRLHDEHGNSLGAAFQVPPKV